MNKKFKASKSLLSYLENVLHRNGISYKVINNKNELFIETDISGTHFHNYVVRAKMEKLQEEKKKQQEIIWRSCQNQTTRENYAGYRKCLYH